MPNISFPPILSSFPLQTLNKIAVIVLPFLADVIHLAFETVRLARSYIMEPVLLTTPLRH